MKSNNRHDILPQYNRGDPAAFGRIYQEYYALIYAYTRRLIRDEEEAKDIVSATFLKLWNRKLRFENHGKLKSFLYRTAGNACLDYLKHNRVRQKFETDGSNCRFNEPENGLEAAEQSAEIKDRIGKAIEILPPKCREVFKLYFFEGLKDSEIAERLNRSVKTVFNQRSIALNYLRVNKLLRFVRKIIQ